MNKWVVALLLLSFSGMNKEKADTAWIRINQLGYTPAGVKVAVWCSKDQLAIDRWQLVDARSNKIVLSGKAGKALWSLWTIYSNIPA